MTITPTLSSSNETFARGTDDFLIAKIQWSIPWLVFFGLPIAFHSWSLSTLWSTLVTLLPAYYLFLSFSANTLAIPFQFLLSLLLHLLVSSCWSLSQLSLGPPLLHLHLLFWWLLPVHGFKYCLQPDKSQWSLSSPDLSPHSRPPLTQLVYQIDTTS